jgi:hypothetical protein
MFIVQPLEFKFAGGFPVNPKPLNVKLQQSRGFTEFSPIFIANISCNVLMRRY